VPADQPLRLIREMVNRAMKGLDADFNALYSELGRDSFPPEKLLRAQLLMAFYTIRSGRYLIAYSMPSLPPIPDEGCH